MRFMDSMTREPSRAIDAPAPNTMTACSRLGGEARRQWESTLADMLAEPAAPATGGVVRFRDTWRALVFVASGLVTGIASFVWCLATGIVCAVIGVTHLGSPAFLAANAGVRQLANAERRRAGALLGRVIAKPYRASIAGSTAARAWQQLRHPATWRDLAWLAVLGPLGLTCFLVAVVSCGVVVILLFTPLWATVVPNPNPPVVVEFFVGSWPGRFSATALGLGFAPVAMWLAQRVAFGQARFASSLLGVGERQRLSERAEQLVATRARVVDAQAAELRRIERDLHDGTQARIVAAGMSVALAERRTGDAATKAELSQVRKQLDEALRELRHLVRRVHPPILTDLGLYEAINALAGDSPLEVDVEFDDTSRVAPAVESAAYFVVAETLTNAMKHAQATAVSVRFGHRKDGSPWMMVADNGRGGADPQGSGLDGLRRRVEALDGRLTVASPVGGPTVISVEFPCAL